jgi:hypothetical protein
MAYSASARRRVAIAAGERSLKSVFRTSALGQKQTSDWRPLMSALPQKRTLPGDRWMFALCQQRTHAPQQLIAIY